MSIMIFIVDLISNVLQFNNQLDKFIGVLIKILVLLRTSSTQSVSPSNKSSSWEIFSYKDSNFSHNPTSVVSLLHFLKTLSLRCKITVWYAVSSIFVFCVFLMVLEKLFSPYSAWATFCWTKITLICCR